MSTCAPEVYMLEIVLGIILLIAAVFLVVAVLMQSGKAKNLSGTIAGGAETFLGKNRAKAADKKLSTLTTIVAIIFVVLVIVVYVIQPDTAAAGDNPSSDIVSSDTASSDNTPASSEETSASSEEAPASSEEAPASSDEAQA
ncbi:MAG: preprotein translocase subunit SecG [Clostridia bacterium]|nr:preprotein translocase subunit SecG [Clostridia bacterium]